MSSLFKRASLLLLAVAAGTLTASLCAPARAATASYYVCQGDPNSTTGIRSIVHVNMTDFSQWNGAIFYTQLLNGNESYKSMRYTLNSVYGPGDFYYPTLGSGYYYYIFVNGGGTYNNWCICDGGNSGGGWSASTGGTNWVYRSGS